MQDETQAAHKPQLDHEFSKPWEQSDVILVVEGQQFHVHRLILSMSSPVFSRMFSSDFKEKDADEIPLPEKKADEIREMLLVIYPSYCKRVDGTNFQFLLPLAREYQIKVLTEKCEDHLLKVIEKEHKIGPLFENLIIAQDYTLERVKSEIVTKTQKLSIEQVRGHQLYEQVEPLSQLKMIELQMSNMEKRIQEAKSELRESKAENTKLQNQIKNMRASANFALQRFDLVVNDLGTHIRLAALQTRDALSHFGFHKFTTEQNLSTIKCDNSHVTREKTLWYPFCGTHSSLNDIQECLKQVQDMK